MPDGLGHRLGRSAKTAKEQSSKVVLPDMPKTNGGHMSDADHVAQPLPDSAPTLGGEDTVDGHTTDNTVSTDWSPPRVPGPYYDPDEAGEKIATLEAEITRLKALNGAMVRQLNQGVAATSGAVSMVERTIELETKVRDRTAALERALEQIESANRDLRRTKDDAQTAESRLAEAIESISEGFVLFDSDDKLALCNSKYRSFWAGITDKIKPGISFDEIVELAIKKKAVASAYVNPEEWVAERRAKHKSPTEPFVVALADGRWMQVSERRTRDGGRVAVFTDITEIKQFERRRREKELGETSALLQATLDNLSQGVSVFDKNTRLVAWNGRFQQMLKLETQQVYLGVTFEQIANAIESSGAFSKYNSYDETRAWFERSTGNAPFVNEFHRADGTIIEVRRNRMPQGGFVSTYTDVTAERRAADALRDSKVSLEQRVRERTAELTRLNNTLVREISVRSRVEEALRVAKGDADSANLSKTRFIAAASHDLLQPLNAARLFATALVETEQSPKQRTIVDNLDQSLGSVEDLLNALLDISKIDSGVVHAEPTDFNLGRVLTTLATEFAPSADEKKIDLRVVPSSVAVHSDLRLLRRILQNFVTNAIRYTRTGKVLVGCRHLGTSVRVEVWDTGIGIPEDRLGEVFEEFKRLSNPAESTEDDCHAGLGSKPKRRADNGLGLGLAIVQRIGALLGHPIDLKSELGKGTVFSITIPLARGPVAAPTMPQRQAAGGQLAGTKILFIDNEVSVVEGMLALLEGWSCETYAAMDLEEAMEQVETLDMVPDVIIADYHLDNEALGTNAVTTLQKRLEGSAGSPKVPGVIITADRTDEVRDEIKEKGLHLLNKPLKPAALRALVTHLLSPSTHDEGQA